MDEISYVAFLVVASVEIPCTGLLIGAPGYQDVWYFGTLNKKLKTIDITLDNRKTPFFVNFILIQLFQKP